MGISSIDHLTGIWDNLKKDYHSKVKIDKFLSPHGYVINRLSYHLANGAIDYLIKPSYKYQGIFLVKTVGLFSEKASKKIDDFWHDPISTQKALSVSLPLENTFKSLSKRKATTYPLLSYIDKSIIAASKWPIAPGITFVNGLLQIPDNLRCLINWTPSNEEQQRVSKTLVGKSWEWIKINTKTGSEYLLKIVYKVLKTIEIPFRYIPLVNYSLDKLSYLVDLGVDYLHQKVIFGLNELIDKNEKKIRQHVVAKAVDVAMRPALRYGISAGIKWYIADTLWSVLETYAVQELEHYGLTPGIMQAAYYTLKIARWGLWARCILPTIDTFSKAYSDAPDKELSMLRVLIKHMNYKNIITLINYYNSHLKI